jgi:sigma-B regulation protein RsbU (phosphoserine phosphatase)
VTFQPKLFYRKLDKILHQIEMGSPSEDWYVRLVVQIVESFGEELCIENGRVYTETADGLRLDRDFHSRDPQARGMVIRRGYRPLELILEHGVYLFDESVEGQEAKVEDRLGGFQSAGILIEDKHRRILGFGMRPGWDAVHLDFALSTLRNAINHRLEVEDLRLDIAQAVDIQRSILPREIPPLEGFSIAARSLPATQVGGDFYDFIPESDDMLFVALGDVSGHGVSSALLARDVITGLRMGAERELTTTAIIRRLNRVIARGILSTRFVSLFFGSLGSSGDLFYVNAGHPAPWVFGGRGIRRLKVGGMILGPVPETRFRRGYAQMDPGDTLVLVTDGVLERLDSAGEEFGDQRLEAVVEPLVGRPAEQVLETIFDAAARHGDGRPWADDTSVVVMTRETEGPFAD